MRALHIGTLSEATQHEIPTLITAQAEASDINDRTKFIPKYRILLSH